MIDVARAAGVWHVTVSRVLNDHPDPRAGRRADRVSRRRRAGASGRRHH
ncbi:LacI family DNA-binding transcriptional regulator [Curtobacterium sp. MCBD17_021]